MAASPNSGDSFVPFSADDQNLINEPNKQNERPSSSIFSFAFYQSFFDVDTRQVIDRMVGMLIPQPDYLKNSYLDIELRPNHDLYGKKFHRFIAR